MTKYGQKVQKDSKGFKYDQIRSKGSRFKVQGSKGSSSDCFGSGQVLVLLLPARPGFGSKDQKIKKSILIKNFKN